MKVQLFPPKAPAPPAPPPISVYATEVNQGFDDHASLPLWAYQMVPVGGVRYVQVSDWYGNSVEVDNPACIAIQEVPRLAAQNGLPPSERILALQGLKAGSTIIQFRNGPGQVPFELQVRVKLKQRVEAVFHFVTDGWARMATAFSPAQLHGWLEEGNRILDPEANFRFVFRGPIRYVDLPASLSVGSEVHVGNIPGPGEEGSRFLPYCEKRAVNVFFVWNLYSIKPTGPTSVAGTVPRWAGKEWWQCPAFIGSNSQGHMGRLLVHEMCHVIGATDRENGPYLMNTYYPGNRMDFNNNDAINFRFE